MPGGMWDLSSPTRDRTHLPCFGRQILYHWTTREVPLTFHVTEEIEAKKNSLSFLIQPAKQSASPPTCVPFWYSEKCPLPYKRPDNPSTGDMGPTLSPPFLKNKFIYSFIYLFYFWLRWVFVAAHGLPLVAASGGYSSLWCAAFSLPWLLVAEHKL